MICKRRQLTIVGFIVASGWLLLCTLAVAQSRSQNVRSSGGAELSPTVTQTQDAEEAKLLEGLLELIEPPASPATDDQTADLETTDNAKQRAASAGGEGPREEAGGSESASSGSDTGFKLQPGEFGLSEEDLDEDQSYPLKAIQNSMLIAAGYLQQGLTSSDTQTIQQDIVQRLDELISEIENSNNDQQQSRPQQSASQRSGQEQQSQPQSQSRPQAGETGEQETESSQESTDGDTVQPETGKPRGTGPGQQGQAASGVLEFANPADLQQDIWGQLPERVRRQMQSRMVETFLPSYRKQIEAYYQALLKLNGN